MNFAVDATGAIAMVDDNPGDLELARTCFELSRLTNPWLQFERGLDLLDHLERAKLGEHHLPALVLLDINMPQMNGHQVLERVRGDAYYDVMPVFCMLTGSQEPSDRERAARHGANGFMVKPDTLQELVEFFNSLSCAT
jgi:two-component system, response regulator